MKIKAHIIIALAAIVSLLFLVPIAAVGDENQEREWKEADEWTAMEVNVIFKMDISTSGLFGLSFGSPYVLMEFMFSPENVNPTGMWIELVYDGSQDNISKRLIYDEVNKAFWFPLTQVKLDGSRLTYPFNAYSTEFVILGNVSLKRSEENIDAPGQKFLKTKISWENDTISLKIERNLNDAALLLVIMLTIFVVIFGSSTALFKKSIRGKSRTARIERIGGLSISFVTAMGAVYLVLAAIGAELMPIFSVIFWALAPLAHIILLMFGKIWNKFLKKTSSNNQGGLHMGQVKAGRRWKITKTYIVINGGILFLCGFFLFLLWFIISVREDKPLFATSIMALAIVMTAGISLVSIRQNLHMLTLNQRMVDEMRRSRPKPCVRADIVKNSKRPGYDLIVENIGRELARNIKVHYCSSEIPKSKFGKGQAFGENDLVDSNWIILDVKPLGPKDKAKFPFDFVKDIKIWFVKFVITYSDGVESYEEPQYRIDAHNVRRR